MRARNSQSLRAVTCWLAALAVTFTAMGSWAQDDSNTIPEPPKPPAMESEVPKPDSRVRIMRDEKGVLTIKTEGEDGERSEVQVDLGAEFGGPLSQRIIEKLERKGILDERGRVAEEALDRVPDNVEIGLSKKYDASHKSWEESHSDSGFHQVVTLPVLALLCVFGMPVLIVWLVTRNSYRKKQLVMENINRMVAEGRDVPSEMLDMLEGNTPNNSADKGFTLIAVGAAVFIWLSAMAGVGVGSLGLIPLFIGLARFINWKLDNKQA
ncbi:DUF6249 domain-containing protein [Microbulbifer sp. THAF38]|uniref:DUF6249 domain-containing protein n=1 Tax=Microbulbifer sp. THAF38 TaxID=2587856 RepID=UPI0012A7D890|nr:DUF6249 domain-containing protein [Microbulbifer sp. THAF38]QFT55431.1 hypothetical protein FIU95_12795 [Microbulbifer sp. THAF38]